jgi:predicted transposase YbfD/YdcC
VALLGKTVRVHWRIENGMHRVLKVSFYEDDCRIRIGESPQTFFVLRRIALNLPCPCAKGLGIHAGDG